MEIHAFNTALIDVKRRYVDARGGNRLMRLSSVLQDRDFVPIPVYVWVIEHPEGLIVVDTGESARVLEPDYFPPLQRPYWRSQYRFHVRPEDEIGAQMRRAGMNPQDVRWVILTHTHFDHSDGLHHFPDAEVILSEKEHHDILRYRSAHFGFPSRWPADLKLLPIEYASGPIGPFERSFVLTQSGDVILVPTPGHTPGHQSVIVRDDNHTIFLAGDTSFDLSSLLDGTIDAPTFNAPQLLETRRRILDYAAQVPLVYLPTHDHETPRRLMERQTLLREWVT